MEEKVKLKTQIRDFQFQQCPKNSHENYAMDEVCTDTACKLRLSAICSLCKFEEHQGHSIVPLKVLWIDLVEDIFSSSATRQQHSYDGDEVVYQLEKIVECTLKMREKVHHIHLNAQAILQKYRDLQHSDSNDKVEVKTILSNITLNPEHFGVGMQRLRQKVGIDPQTKQAFVDDIVVSILQKKALQENAKSLLFNVQDMVDRIESYLAKVQDALNPLKAHRRWIERFDTLVEVPRIRQTNLQLSRSAMLQVTENKRYSGNIKQDKEPSDILDTFKVSGLTPKILSRKNQLLQKMNSLRGEMVRHLKNCPVGECSFLRENEDGVPTIKKFIDKVTLLNRGAVEVLRCDQGQRLNNEMNLISQELLLAGGQQFLVDPNKI